MALNRIWWGDVHGNVRNGRFELRGLDPETEVPIHFFEANLKLGATAYFSRKQASGEPVTVRLEPCGAAQARLVDPGGKAARRFFQSLAHLDGRYAWRNRQQQGAHAASPARRRVPLAGGRPD